MLHERRKSMFARAHSPKRPRSAGFFFAACMASTVLGCATKGGGEENLELGRSSEALLWASGGVIGASAHVPAVGQLFIYPVEYCTGTLIDDHTVLTAGHCVCREGDTTCMNGGVFENTDPRSEFVMTVESGGMTTLFKVPVVKWALVNNFDGRDDLALVRLAYRVPGSLASPVPLATAAWGANEVADYGTFGAGPGPDGAPNAKRVALHSGTFTYDNNQNIQADSGDSGGPTIANWGPSGTYTDTKIIAVNSAVNPVGLWSAEPAKHLGWIQGTRVGWDVLGLPPVKATLAESVTWTNLIASEAYCGDLSRDPGWGWSAGASSVEQIAAGDGYVEFSTDETNKSKMAGLSHGDTNADWVDIDYAILLADGGFVQIYEAGALRGDFGSYAPGDVFRVEVSGGRVRYRQNGVVFHSSNVAPTYPLVVDASLQHEDATIKNARIESCMSGDTSCMPVEAWKNVWSATASRDSLTRRVGWGWSAGASSVEEIAAGDGYVEFSTAETNKSKMGGLSHGDDHRDWTDIDYAIFLADGGYVQIYEAGAHRGDFGSYAPEDVFRVEVSGGQVRYRHNGFVFHSSNVPPVYPLGLDTSLEHEGATLTKARVESCEPWDTSCMPVEGWKNVKLATTIANSITRRTGLGWYAGASSVQEIPFGDGYVEFSTVEANRSKMAGLSRGDSHVDWTDIDYAIYMADGGFLQIYEGGIYRGDFGSYVPGDVFRVEVSDGQVRYRQNGIVFHSSNVPPMYPLVLDTSLFHAGATLMNARVESCVPGNVTCMPPETWKNVGLASAGWNWLTRRPGTDWSAGASSVEEIAAGDGYIEFSTAETNKSKMGGLSHGDDHRDWTDIDYAIFMAEGGFLQIYEGGAFRGDFGSYAAGDVFRVEVSGGQVKYLKNGQVLHASAAPPTYPLVLDTSLLHGGATITNASVEPAGCDDVTYAGHCNGNVLVWCENGALATHDCAADGKVCGYQDASTGNNCLAQTSGGGFGYPVGDKTTYPAGGWAVTQVLGHYLNSADGFVGGHLAQDIASDEATTANAPVYSVADGVVLYAGSNTSTYVNVVLIRHYLGGGESICSFYGHLGTTTVAEGQTVRRGDQIATILDWNARFGTEMSHLHYVLLSSDLCAASDAANGALVCGYDDTSGPSGITDLSNEPAVYTSVGDVCGDQNYPDAFHSPSQFIEAHHF
jgi:hypothetical protein